LMTVIFSLLLLATIILQAAVVWLWQAAIAYMWLPN